MFCCRLFKSKSKPKTDNLARLIPLQSASLMALIDYTNKQQLLSDTLHNLNLRLDLTDRDACLRALGPTPDVLDLFYKVEIAAKTYLDADSLFSEALANFEA